MCGAYWATHTTALVKWLAGEEARETYKGLIVGFGWSSWLV
jgi:hypothetical protein